MFLYRQPKKSRPVGMHLNAFLADPLADAGLADTLAYLLGDVDEIPPLCGIEPEVLCIALYGPSSGRITRTVPSASSITTPDVRRAFNALALFSFVSKQTKAQLPHVVSVSNFVRASTP